MEENRERNGVEENSIDLTHPLMEKGWRCALQLAEVSEESEGRLSHSFYKFLGCLDIFDEHALSLSFLEYQ